MTCSTLFFLLLCLVQCSAPASILAVVPTLSVSHFGVFEPLLATLIHRGHSLVVVSGYPLNVEKHYIHVDIKEAKKKFNGSWSLDSFSEIPAPYRDIFSITRDQVKENENIFGLESVQRLLQSGDKFDLIIIEQFISDVFLGFVKKFKVPFITLSTCPSMPWAMDRHGSPGNLAVEPNLFSGYSSRMGFSQRLVNVIQVIYAKIYQQFVLNRISEEMAKRYFGNSAPRLDDIVKNSSLFLVNSHFSLLTGRALPPQVVEVGGIHVVQPKSLHQAEEKSINCSLGTGFRNSSQEGTEQLGAVI